MKLVIIRNFTEDDIQCVIHQDKKRYIKIKISLEINFKLFN